MKKIETLFKSTFDCINWIDADLEIKKGEENLPVLIGKSKSFKSDTYLSFWHIAKHTDYVFVSILENKTFMLPIKANKKELQKFIDNYLSKKSFLLPVHTVNKFGGPSNKDFLQWNKGKAIKYNEQKECIIYLGLGHYDIFMESFEDSLLQDYCLNPYFNCLATAAHQEDRTTTQLHSQLSYSLVSALRLNTIYGEEYANFYFKINYYSQKHSLVYVNGEMKNYDFLEFLPSDIPFDVLASLFNRYESEAFKIIIDINALKNKILDSYINNNHDLVPLDAYIACHSIQEGDLLFMELFEKKYNVSNSANTLEYILHMSIQSLSINVFKKAKQLLGNNFKNVSQQLVDSFIKTHNIDV